MGGDPRLSYMQQIGISGRAASHVVALMNPSWPTNQVLVWIRHSVRHAPALNVYEPGFRRSRTGLGFLRQETVSRRRRRAVLRRENRTLARTKLEGY